jgi:hypothetical protein
MRMSRSKKGTRTRTHRNRQHGGGWFDEVVNRVTRMVSPKAAPVPAPVPAPVVAPTPVVESDYTSGPGPATYVGGKRRSRKGGKKTIRTRKGGKKSLRLRRSIRSRR